MTVKYILSFFFFFEIDSRGGGCTIQITDIKYNKKYCYYRTELLLNKSRERIYDASSIFSMEGNDKKLA